MPMADRAQVRSVEVVETFRAAFLVYLARVRALLEEVGSEVQRTRLWLEADQRGYWDREIRRRTTRVEEAEAALFSARLSTFREATGAELAAVQRARRALSEATDKLGAVRRWARDLEDHMEPMRRQIDALDSVLSHDMVKAAAWLEGVVRSLQEYLEIRLESGGTDSTTAGAASGPSAAGSASGETAKGAGDSGERGTAAEPTGGRG